MYRHKSWLQLPRYNQCHQFSSLRWLCLLPCATLPMKCGWSLVNSAGGEWDFLSAQWFKYASIDSWYKICFYAGEKWINQKWKPVLGGRAVCELLDKYDEWFQSEKKYYFKGINMFYPAFLNTVFWHSFTSKWLFFFFFKCPDYFKRL